MTSHGAPESVPAIKLERMNNRWLQNVCVTLVSSLLRHSRWQRMNNARRISRGVVFSIFVLTTRVAKDLGRFNVESKSMSPEHDEYEQLSLIRNTETECAFNLITSGKQSSPLG